MDIIGGVRGIWLLGDIPARPPFSCQSGSWAIAASGIVSSGDYSAPGVVSFTTNRPVVLIVSGYVWRSPIGAMNEGIIGLLIDGAVCAFDRSIEDSGTNAHSSASCVRYLPAGNHSVGATDNLASWSSFKWSYAAIKM